MAFTDKAFIGIGKVHVRLAGSTGARRYIGNVSVLKFKHTLDVKRSADYTRPGGGTLKKIERLKQVDAEITMLDFNSANLALAVAGTATAVVGGTVTDEIVKSYKDSTLRLAYPPSAITTVKNSGGSTTYVAGTDYDITASGLYIRPGTAIVDAVDLKVTYTYGAHDRIEAATGTSSIMEVLFEGLNDAEGDVPTITDIWRMQFPSAAELDLIGDNLGELKFTAELLKDSTKGPGLSAFYRIQAG